VTAPPGRIWTPSDLNLDVPITLDLTAFRGTIGSNVKRVREDAGLSQATLGDALLVKPSAISRVEKGEHEARLSTLARFAFVMQIPLMTFLDGLDPLPMTR
jgi:ribosome-binding protein aMBF1 (putative translation factor)